MIFKNAFSQKIISFFLIIAVLSPAFIIFSMPKKSSAIFGVADVVFDPALFAKEVWKVIKETIRQFLMAIARKLLDKITQSTINWINSGFRGKPLFVENPGSFFKDIAKEQLKGIVNELGYDPIRFPFGKQYAMGIIDQAKGQFEQNAQYSLSKYYQSSAELEYRRENFNVGGWNDFILNTQFPQNNFIGFGIIADEELATRVSGENSQIQTLKNSVQQGMGFLSPQACKSNPNWDPEKISQGIPESDLPPYNPPSGNGMDVKVYNDVWNAQVRVAKNTFQARYGCKEGPVATTPGSVVSSQIMTALGSKQRQGELGAALGNSLAALFDALLNHFFNKGLTALSGAVTSTSNPSINDFNYFGDTGGGYAGNPPTNPEPKITVSITLINDNGGTATQNDVQAFVDGAPVQDGVALVYDTGGHNISATTPVDYVVSISGDCSSGGFVTLSIGDNKTCYITVDDVISGGTGRLTVRKIVINDNGGTLLADNVQLFVNGTQKLNNVEYVYASGTYTVTEINPVGYTATFGGDCASDGSITISDNDVLECTITNNDL